MLLEVEADLNEFLKFIGLIPFDLELLGLSGEKRCIGESNLAVLIDPEELEVDNRKVSF